MNNTNTLTITYALTELLRQEVSKEDAAKIMTEACYCMEKIVDGLDNSGLSEEQVAIAKAMILRMLISNEKYRNDEYCAEFIELMKTNDLLFGHNKTFPTEVSITMTARAVNKYNDFIFFLMLSEGLTYETYHSLVAVGKEEIHRSVASALSIYEKVADGNISMFLFSSILEDALSTSVTPVLEGISKSSKLRQHFIVDPRQVLVPISAHVTEKVKNSIYLADALIKTGTK
jgi:hypothetical protein